MSVIQAHGAATGMGKRNVSLSHIHVFVGNKLATSLRQFAKYFPTHHNKYASMQFSRQKAHKHAHSTYLSARTYLHETSMPVLEELKLIIHALVPGHDEITTFTPLMLTCAHVL
jgi:hypothetical protein